MWTCNLCLKRMGLPVPEHLVMHACSVCNTPLAECAEDASKVNNEVSNWHKYSEDKPCSSSQDNFEIPANGLYLWLRPKTSTSRNPTN
jgi:hypothetical protein